MKELTLLDNAHYANVDGRPTALAEEKVDCSEKNISHSNVRAVSRLQPEIAFSLFELKLIAAQDKASKFRLQQDFHQLSSSQPIYLSVIPRETQFVVEHDAIQNVRFERLKLEGPEHGP